MTLRSRRQQADEDVAKEEEAEEQETEAEEQETGA